MENKNVNVQFFELKQQLEEVQNRKYDKCLVEKKVRAFADDLQATRNHSERVYENLGELFFGTDLLPYVDDALEENRNNFLKQMATIDNVQEDLRHDLEKINEEEDWCYQQIGKLKEE